MAHIGHIIETQTIERDPATAQLLATLIAHERDHTHTVWSIGRRPARDAALEAVGLRVDHHHRPRLVWLGNPIRAQGADVIQQWPSFLIQSPIMDSTWINPERGVDRSLIDRVDRRALRMSIGVADESTLVVTVAARRPDEVDAPTAMLAAGLAAESGRDVRLIVPPAARGLDRALRVTEAAGRRRTVIVTDWAALPWMAAAAADAALMLAPQGDSHSFADSPVGLAEAWAMAGGLAMVGSVDRGPWVLRSRNGRAGALAQRLCQLYDDRERLQQLGSAARAEAMRRFDPAVFAARMSDLYSRATGEPTKSGPTVSAAAG